MNHYGYPNLSIPSIPPPCPRHKSSSSHSERVLPGSNLSASPVIPLLALPSGTPPLSCSILPLPSSNVKSKSTITNQGQANPSSHRAASRDHRGNSEVETAASRGLQCSTPPPSGSTPPLYSSILLLPNSRIGSTTNKCQANSSLHSASGRNHGGSSDKAIADPPMLPNDIRTLFTYSPPSHCASRNHRGINGKQIGSEMQRQSYVDINLTTTVAIRVKCKVNKKTSATREAPGARTREPCRIRRSTPKTTKVSKKDMAKPSVQYFLHAGRARQGLVNPLVLSEESPESFFAKLT